MIVATVRLHYKTVQCVGTVLISFIRINVTKSNDKSAKRQRSTWIASMVACFLFLLMAVKVYQVPINDMLGNLLTMSLGLLVIIGAAAGMASLILVLRQRKK